MIDRLEVEAAELELAFFCGEYYFLRILLSFWLVSNLGVSLGAGEVECTERTIRQ